uniref:De novo designed small beta-barrel protein 29_bp_sh3 n=1 Tax=synthetic construct TaxID=32630 RepID=UPI0023E47A16|nr:Chain A, De novo designed small beta-barrel protein 29_bp_sh3 [synthetic construct]
SEVETVLRKAAERNKTVDIHTKSGTTVRVNVKRVDSKSVKVERNGQDLEISLDQITHVDGW